MEHPLLTIMWVAAMCVYALMGAIVLYFMASYPLWALAGCVILIPLYYAIKVLRSRRHHDQT